MDEAKQKFPYLELIGILALSAIVTASIFWVWHRVELHSLTQSHSLENNKVREEIRVLTEHVNTLGGGMKT